jgi:hypothetical protein
VTEAFDGSQYLVCGLGQFEGLRVVVVLLDEATDSASRCLTEVCTSLDLLSREFSELDLIDP